MGTQRFAASQITQTALLAGSYLVSNWTTSRGLQWVVDSENVVTPYAQRVKSFGGQTFYQGQTTVSPWIFNAITGTMFDYLTTTVFSNKPSTVATIYTFNQQKQAYQTYQCIATLGEITGEALQPWANLGFRDVRIDFSQCVINTS